MLKAILVVITFAGHGDVQVIQFGFSDMPTCRAELQAGTFNGSIAAFCRPAPKRGAPA